MWVKRAELVESVQIVADADRLTSRAGTALLLGLADRVGLSGALSPQAVLSELERKPNSLAQELEPANIRANTPETA